MIELGSVLIDLTDSLTQTATSARGFSLRHHLRILLAMQENEKHTTAKFQFLSTNYCSRKQPEISRSLYQSVTWKEFNHMQHMAQEMRNNKAGCTVKDYLFQR